MKARLLRLLADSVEGALSAQDEKTGRFLSEGSFGWAVTYQDVILALSYLYLLDDPRNALRGDARLLRASLAGGDALADFQNEDGSFEFVKPDGSRWGPTYMPWTAYHWLEAFLLLRGELDGPRRERWNEALGRLLSGIHNELASPRVHNIPAWKAMTLIRAGRALDRPEWLQRGRDVLGMICGSMTPDGYWAEHGGPTTSYNRVYIHALGLAHAFGESRALGCLERANRFQAAVTYPDGTNVETVDGRVKYRAGVGLMGAPGFAATPEGRGLLRRLVENFAGGRHAGWTPHAVSALMFWQEGEEAELPSEYAFELSAGALVRRHGDWVWALSAIVAEREENRWAMDRSNLVSVWHSRAGLIVGGGNSKDQAEWSTFRAPDGSFVPESGQVNAGPPDRLSVQLGGGECSLTCALEGGSCAMTARGPEGAEHGLMLRLKSGDGVRTGAGEFALGQEPVAAGTKGLVRCERWEIECPPESVLHWPLKPFNPYAKDGASGEGQWQARLCSPLGGEKNYRISPVV